MTIRDDAPYPLPTPSRTGSVSQPPRPRPWFLGEAPAPSEEPPDDDGQALMRSELVDLPLIRDLRDLLEFIGEGRRVTKQRRLYSADRKLFAAQADRGPQWGTSFAECPSDDAWRLLLERGWLTIEDGQVRPSEQPPFPGAFAPDAEHFLDACRFAVAIVLDRHGEGLSSWWGTSVDDDVLEALLVASGSAGLVLPDHPSAGAIGHCCEMERLLIELVRHPWIREVPIDRSTGHIDPGELRRLAWCWESLDSLARTVMLRQDRVQTEPLMSDGYSRREYGEPPRDESDGLRVRAPLIMRGAVALVREWRRAPGRMAELGDHEPTF